LIFLQRDSFSFPSMRGADSLTGVFIPVMLHFVRSLHWSLAIICNPSSFAEPDEGGSPEKAQALKKKPLRILYLDSLGCRSHRRYGRLLLQ
jgi:Ulp1 family protease